MESKRVMMLVTIMIVMENLVIQTEAQSPSPFGSCYTSCIVSCAIAKKFPNSLMCPLTCIMTCLAPPSAIPSPPSPMFLTKKIDHSDYYCKLGCATRHCVPLSSVQNPNVDKVADCVDSCSDKCSTKSK